MREQELLHGYHHHHHHHHPAPPIPTPPLHHSAWYPAVAEPDTKNFTTEPATIKPSYNHQSNDDASLQQLVRAPELPTAETWLAFLSALGAVTALDVGSRPQVVVVVVVVIIIIIMVIPVIIGATGTISKSFRKYMSNIPGNHDIRELQKTAIMGTAHILRKVLT